jgi:predicted nucleic acid-binding protein
VIVLDASAVVELLRKGQFAEAIRSELADAAGPPIAPHLLDIEVTSALRRLTAVAHIDSNYAQLLLAELADLPVRRCAHTPLLDRVWELRHNFTAYDAIYIALAEETDSVLYTTDAKLRRGHRAQVRVLG